VNKNAINGATFSFQIKTHSRDKMDHPERINRQRTDVISYLRRMNLSSLTHAQNTFGLMSQLRKHT